ncbi:DMT family transporter [Tabrizicola sp. BL-A-41-H6]|uniref:DMT family transporter n=1 Tax=Tabrizicola sp. BL-A-41-H6 TaxID=3421107 RepID=UPI003D670B3D
MHHDGAVTGRLGAALIILAAGLWATVGVSVKLVPDADNLPPEMLGLVRTLFAGPLILCFCALTGLGVLAGARSVGPQRLVQFALAGLVFQICLFRSFEALGVTLTVALTVCLPPLIATLRAQMRGTRTGPASAAALILALLGLGLCSAGQLADSGDTRSATGLGLALTASVAFVWMTDVARTMAQIIKPITVAGLGLTATGVLFCVAVPFLVTDPMTVITQAAGSWQVSGVVVYLAVVPTALAYICYCTGIARCRSTAVGLTASMIEPAIAALFAVLLLGEHLTPNEIAGCLMMAAAMVILVLSESRMASQTAPRRWPVGTSKPAYP